MNDPQDRRRIEGQGIQIGDGNTQVNYYGANQWVVAGRDAYTAGRDINLNRPQAAGDESSERDSVPRTLLSGRQVQRLSDALVAAFDEQTLEVFLLEELDKDLAHLTPPRETFPYRVFKLIRRADQEGWVTDLISRAARARPRNTALQDLATETSPQT
ncbi:MAG TPA: effector-associated domain EAD1-containing protein [Trebonia sp.]|nr:effector-associated domain EAD1-containing protein [Trebonia sp.]